jgi:methylthioribose-1-phosphate isomerase
MEQQQWCAKQQLTVHSQNVQHLDQSLMKPCQLEVVSSHTLISNCGAAKRMEIRAAKMIKYCRSAWVTDETDLFVSFSVSFYEHIKVTKPR